jgi:L-asparaginase
MARNNEAQIQEVAIYFESQLYRGNRTHKYNTENFDAFQSANFPALADVGVHIFYRSDLLIRPEGDFKIASKLDGRVAVVKIFPGITESVLRGTLNAHDLKGIVLETFGAGNFPQKPALHEALRDAIDRDIVIVNVSQCNKGFVEQGRYETSYALQKMGVIGGADMTSEAALTKLMHLLGQGHNPAETERLMMTSLRGELTAFSAL